MNNRLDRLNNFTISSAQKNPFKTSSFSQIIGLPIPIRSYVNKENKQLKSIPDDFKLSRTEFTHILRAMMDSGAIAAMSGSAHRVYIIIKILSGFDDGKTTASSVQIGEKTGISRGRLQGESKS